MTKSQQEDLTHRRQPSAPDPTTVKIVLSVSGAYPAKALTHPTSLRSRKSWIGQYGTSWTDSILIRVGGDGPFKVLSYSHEGLPRSQF